MPGGREAWSARVSVGSRQARDSVGISSSSELVVSWLAVLVVMVTGSAVEDGKKS